MEKATHIKDTQMVQKKQPKCVNCRGAHVANYKGCPAYKKTNVPSACGGQSKKLCLDFEAKFGPSSATQGWHILFHSRSAHKICSHCGHPSRSATGVLHKCPKKTQLTKSQVCVDEFLKQLKANYVSASLGVACLKPLVAFAPQCSLPPEFQSSYQNPSDSLHPPSHQPF